MKSRPVFCPNCSSRLRAENIHVQELTGKCECCDNLFSLDLRRITPDSGAPGPKPSRPKGVATERGWDGELLIVRRWFELGLFGLLFFCILWDGFLVCWYSAMLTDWKGWHAILIPILHLAVGVCLTYGLVGGFLNKTVIYVDWEMLRVRHGPVPWPGNRDLLVDEIHGMEIDYVRASNGQPDYALTAHTDGRGVVLLTGMNCEQAKFIAWQIADYLSVPLSHCKSTFQSRRPTNS